jgi:SanA protein
MILFPLIILAGLFCLYLYLVIKTSSRIFHYEKVPFNRYTLVLGAGLEKNGLPTDILSDRVKTAINLINNNKTDFLILSGSANSQNISEPVSMKYLAQSLGVDTSNLILDNQGKTTFDSLINLSKISGKNQITIVTQRFHLPRAIWLAEALGYQAYGTPANLYNFSAYKIAYWYLREVFALPINFFKLLINRRVLKK